MAASTARASRSGGVLPIVAGVVSAMALTGAAVFTVGQAACGDGGQYIRHDNQVVLEGACVDGRDLPRVGTGAPGTDRAGAAKSKYQP